MNASKFHKIRDFEYAHRKKYDASLCEKIQRLAEAVDFQHAKHNFFSVFLHVQDQVKERLSEVIREKEPMFLRMKKGLSKLFAKSKIKTSLVKSAHVIKKHLIENKERVLEVMHMDEIIDYAVNEAIKKKEFKAKAERTLESAAGIVSTNFVQPLREVCTVSAFERFSKFIKLSYYKFKAGMHMASKPVFAGARVFSVFAIIFAITFTILNAQALTTITKDHIKTNSFMSEYFTAKEAAKEYVEVESLEPAPEDLVLAEDERQVNKDKLQLLPLDIQVTPDDNRIMIPRIGKNIPLSEVSDEKVIYSDRLQDIEDSIQEALQDGVVRYPGTAKPGEQGNVFLTGHSSYYLTAPGDYKDVFALLHKVELNDEIVVYYNQRRFKYKVTEIKQVWPSQVDVLKQTDDYRLTLMTCTPIGTNLKRLIVTAIQVE
ncbi:MAG: class E sortase [Candidatus Peregrinibacteria bacterium]|nr:class E sortase [Candidatus Peregrinibacteria bacterium]MDZ4244480.1 class E sortase [Candidatus Gracilibacteria bacterium]